MNSNLLRTLAAAVALLSPIVANAHIGAGATAGALAGFTHPFSGLDHLLVMLGVGLWAAQMGGRASWLVPSCFILVMIFGGTLAITGILLPFVEQGILLSVLVMGLLISTTAQLPVLLSMAIVGIFALFHGHAHGSEMSFETGFLPYATGFVLATSLLHAAGIFAVVKLKNLRLEKAIRMTGAGITLAGISIAVF